MALDDFNENGGLTPSDELEENNKKIPEKDIINIPNDINSNNLDNREGPEGGDLEEIEKKAYEMANEYKEQDAKDYKDQLDNFETSKDVNGNLRLSNEIKEIKMEEKDYDKIKERAHCDDSTIDKIYNKVEKMYDKYLELEPALTKELVGIVNESGGIMYDASWRIKQMNSCAGKIGQDIWDNAEGKFTDENIEKFANGITDIARYTGVFENEDYVNACQTIKSKLEQMGCQVKVKNHWKYKNPNDDIGYRDVNMKCRKSDGIKFELQLHTKESQSAKNVSHELYEKIRNGGSELEEKVCENRTKNIKSLYSGPSNINDL